MDIANEEVDPEHYLQEFLKKLSPAQRTAFAVCMAERFLPVYETFSKAEKWGAPDQFRSSLLSIWAHLEGKELTQADLARQMELVEAATPHMDDFEDAYDALASAVMVHQALACCRSNDNLEPALQSAISGFEGVVPGWSDRPEDQFTPNQKNKIKNEFKQQTWLLEEVRKIDHFNQEIILTLKEKVAQNRYIGNRKRESSSGPALVTNQILFEQYRRMVQADIRNSGQRWRSFETMTDMKPMLLFSRWAGRYSRRKQTIDGSYGKPADILGQQALIARNKAIDAAARGPLDWKPIQRSTIERSLRNPYSGIDAKSVDEPHGYGPSVRQLWLEAKRRNTSDDDAWEQLVVWAEHIPQAWAMEDLRKRKKGGGNTVFLSKYQSRIVNWLRTSDAIHPWEALVDVQQWTIQMNDFPDEYMYSLMVDGKEQGRFNEWPKDWVRE